MTYPFEKKMMLSKCMMNALFLLLCVAWIALFAWDVIVGIICSFALFPLILLFIIAIRKDRRKTYDYYKIQKTLSQEERASIQAQLDKGTLLQLGEAVFLEDGILYTKSVYYVPYAAIQSAVYVQVRNPQNPLRNNVIGGGIKIIADDQVYGIRIGTDELFHRQALWNKTKDYLKMKNPQIYFSLDSSDR